MKNLRIKTKFYIFILLVMVFVGVVSVWDSFFVDDADKAFHSAFIRENKRMTTLFEMKLVVSGFFDKESVSETHATSSSMVHYDQEMIAESISAFDKLELSYRENISSTETGELSLLDEIERAKTKVISASRSVSSRGESATSASSSTPDNAELISSLGTLREALQNAIDEKVAYISVLEKTTQAKEDHARDVQLILVFTSVVLVAWFGLFIRSRVIQPLDKVREDMRLIANKERPNLEPPTQQDEVGEIARFFNTMARELQVSDSDLLLKKEETVSKTLALEAQVSETERTKLAVLNLLEDIEGEKKNAELMVQLRTKELSEEKSRLLASIGSLSLGFVIANEKHELLLKNPAIDQILGIAEDAQSLHEIVGRIGEFNILDACNRSMETHQVVEKAEISYGKKYLRFFCAPIFEGASIRKENANAIGYVFLLEDITEAKVMERSRDEFFAIASHELRTPLTAIRGNVSMILDMYAEKIVDQDMKDMLNDVNESSVRLISIVNDFIEVSRIEQGKVETKKEVFDLTEIISKITRGLQISISNKNLELHTAVPEGISQVCADKGYVEQILVNLVGNALKFTHDGGITVEAKEFGDFVKITVSDTGMGISEHNQALLFRKFQQAGENMLARDNSQSSGLGLYISRLLAIKMGGNIELEKSDLGKGSTFSLTIPISK